MTAESKSGAPLDMIVVVGGWDSSNTGHLLEIPVHEGLTAYHINSAKCIGSDNSITHRTVDGAIEVGAERRTITRARRRAHMPARAWAQPQRPSRQRALSFGARLTPPAPALYSTPVCPQTTSNFLPLDRPVRIGISSGASTPDSSVQDVLESLQLLKKLAKRTVPV